jgi:hypothetical protein
MKMNIKHKSKLQLGFQKQVARQELKPGEVKIKLPIAIKLPNNFKGKYKHYFTVTNSVWNGMNLKNIYNSFSPLIVGGMYGKFTINNDGKYILSRHGKDLLRKKKLKKSTP